MNDANISRPVHPRFFGKDHWSTFGYIETRCVDHEGAPNNQHMRCDASRHPLLSHAGSSKKYATILADNVELFAHDDWDCLDDLETAGLLESHGTGLHPRYKLTTLGLAVASTLRKHKSDGKSFSEFRWTP